MTQRRRAAAVGNFDGVHQGHRLVIERLKNAAEQRGLSPLAVTFDLHPLQVVAPERAPKIITTIAERIEKIKSMGAEVAVLHFDAELRALSAHDFMAMLKKEYNVDLLMVGYDNRFGSNSHNMEQDAAMALYMRYGEELGIEVMASPELGGVSSSVVRNIIAEGYMATAAQWLCAPYVWSGTVVRGKMLGRTIGFPTVNLVATEPTKILPAPGVYVADAELQNGDIRRAMVNIGTCPTVDGDTMTVEAHLLEFNGDLYGENVSLHFLRRMREERKFPTIEALCNQLERDKRLAESE
jgi:riboflavin kinase/FMN adenylyltransferase